MDYDLIYDAAQSFAGLEILAITGPLCLIFLTVLFFEKFVPPVFYTLMFKSAGLTSWVRAYIACAVLLLGAVTANIIYTNVKLGALSKKNTCTEIAGTVTNFEPATNKNTKESFTLNQVKFEYSAQTIKPGFNLIAAEGGPIYDGANIKLCYIERVKNRKNYNTILRLETLTDKTKFKVNE